VLGRRDCQVANSRSTGPRQQNTDDRNCSDNNAERSTSVNWRTADADDHQRRYSWCATVHQVRRSHSMTRSIHQHGELESYTRSVTSSQRSSSCSSRDKPLSNFRVLTTRAAEFITRCSVSVVNLGDPASTASIGVQANFFYGG